MISAFSAGFITSVTWGQVARCLARAANRNNNQPDNQNNNLGLRCVVGAGEPGAIPASQVYRVYGHGASAQEDHSRSGPGWVASFDSTQDTSSPVPASRFGLTVGAGDQTFQVFKTWKV